MDAGQLFVRTLADLERRTASTDEYEVLLSVGLLRKLLMDDTPLMDQLNATYRLKIRFPMNGESAYERLIHDDAPMFWSLFDGIDPESPTQQPPGMRALVSATRDQLLGRRILRFNGTWITVRDLISQLANIGGAVHRSNPGNERQRLLEAVDKVFYVGPMPVTVAQVRSINRVVMRGLVPLRDAISHAGTVR